MVDSQPKYKLDRVATKTAANCTPQVYLHGYYGGGNLGDDILLKVAYSVVREIVPAAGIAIAAASRSYISQLLGEECTVITPGEACRAPIISVAGGGGLHFGFRGGNWGAATAQWLLHRVGAARLHRLEQVVAPRRRTVYSAALGIGVGPFSRGTWNEVRSALTLAEYQWIAVRDPDSLAQCKEWQLPGLIVESTDGAFMHSRWCADNVPRRRRVGSPRIAIVVRDWTHSTPDNAYLPPLTAAAAEFRASGIFVKYLSFDPVNDTAVLQKLPDEDVHSWKPDGGLISFLSHLGDFDLVISARAHGVIIAACLGVPSIAIGVEPKLHAVCRMLDPVGQLWEPPYSARQLISMATSVLASQNAEVDRLAHVVAREQAKAETCAGLLQSSINHVLNELGVR